MKPPGRAPGGFSAPPDKAFHRIALAFTGDQGLSEVTGMDADKANFRTPRLRNVGVSGPYLHDGSAKTLSQSNRRHRAAMALSAALVADLVAYP